MSQYRPTLDDILNPIARRLTVAVQELTPEPAPHPHTIPPDPRIYLDHISEVSRTARANWFGLLVLLAFAGVTLMGHKDADFFAWGATTKLPVVGVEVPVKSFFAAASVLIAALYAYFHLYLFSLWDALADAPPVIDRRRLADRVYPWLISHAALWYRNRKRRQPDGEPEGCTAPHPLGWMVIAVSLTLGWAFGFVLLLLFWVRSLPAHDQWLTLWIALCLWIAAMVGWKGLRAACERMAGAPRNEVARPDIRERRAGVVFAVVLAVASWETTQGSGLLRYPAIGEDGSLEWRRINTLYPADLVNRHLTREPSGWQLWHLWMEDFAEKFRRREGIAPGSPLNREQEATLMSEATERYSEYLSQLDFPDLRRADLRYARMSGAFLPGANLRKASAQRANFRRAEMQGVNLFAAEVQGAILLWAQLQRIDLRKSKLQGAYLAEAEMQDAQLGEANMQGAYLVGADMSGAECSGTIFDGALLHSANVTCGGLTQEQLRYAVGDDRTILPPGLAIASCLKAVPKDVEAALAYHPASGDRFRIARADLRKKLLCKAGEAPRFIGIPSTD